MKRIAYLFKRIPRWLIVLVCLGVAGYVWWSQSQQTAKAQYVIIEPIGTGEVSTGITAQGTIAAAQKIDLNVYKQELRLRQVGVQNGARVQPGEVLFAFDAGDIANSVRTASLELQSARLAEREAVLKAQETNYTIAEQQQSLRQIKTSLAQQAETREQAKRTFYSVDLEFQIPTDRYSRQVGRSKPQVSGTYTDDAAAYQIEMYRSGAESGFSYRLTGKETAISNVYPGVEQPLGTLGLRVTFPADLNQIAGGDVWRLAIPNVDAASYLDNKKTYDDTLQRLQDELASQTISQDSTAQQIAANQRADAAAHKQLAVDQARLRVAQAAEALRSAQRTVAERTITAPFSGTINGVRNVVTGTKLRTDDTTVQFGTLLSDEFQVSFALRIEDVTRVAIGDALTVRMPSLPTEPAMNATITEVSVIPNDNNSYDVLATLAISTSTRAKLREGVTADIAIAKESVTDAVRAPKAALQYEDGRPYVQVVSALPEVAQQDIAQTGTADFTQFDLTAQKRFVTVGLSDGQFAQITEGLQAGEYVLTTVPSATAAGPASADVYDAEASYDDY